MRAFAHTKLANYLARPLLTVATETNVSTQDQHARSTIIPRACGNFQTYACLSFARPPIVCCEKLWAGVIRRACHARA